MANPGSADGEFADARDAGRPPPFVADGAFDLAVGTDGVADRIVVVDGDGSVVHEDTVVAVLAHHYVAASDATDTVVVTTPNASGRVERVRLGALHGGIAAARKAGGDGTEVVFAAEPWKHVHPAFGGWIDGVVSAAVTARLVAGAGLAALRDTVAERPYRKVSVDYPDDRKTAVMVRVESSEFIPLLIERNYIY